MNRFSIGTLTHDAIKRDFYLELTINTFLENTNLPENTVWFIFHNGQSNSPVVEMIRKMNEKWSNKVNFMLLCEEKNYGVGAGINKLNEWTKLTKYSLFLEGDWLTLPQDLSGFNKDWLIRSLDMMETDDIEQVQLRKFQNDVEDRQFGLGYWTNEKNVIKFTDDFVYLKEREYTNNPHIRNNQRYYDIEIFPLNEFFDEHGNATETKESTHWGQAEISAENKGRQLKSVWLLGGNMVHGDHWKYNDDWETAKHDLLGCGWKTRSFINCKYGFTSPRPEFCVHCNKDKNFTDLEEHNWRFERNL